MTFQLLDPNDPTRDLKADLTVRLSLIGPNMHKIYFWSQPGWSGFKSLCEIGASLSNAQPYEIFCAEAVQTVRQGNCYVIFRERQAAPLIVGPSEKILRNAGRKASVKNKPFPPLFMLAMRGSSPSSKKFYCGDNIGFTIFERNFVPCEEAIRGVVEFLKNKDIEDISKWECMEAT